MPLDARLGQLGGGEPREQTLVLTALWWLDTPSPPEVRSARWAHTRQHCGRSSLMQHTAPRMATVDDIPSWSRLAPNAAVSFAKLQEERRSRELAEEARLAEEAAGEWLAAWPGGDLHTKDEGGWSALQRAAEAGQAAAVAELLRRPGVDVNGLEPTKGRSALVLASEGRHVAVMQVLLASRG